MSKDDEISVKDLLLTHIEDSKEYRRDMTVSMQTFHNMTMEELVKIKNDVERFNDIEAQAKGVFKVSKWLGGMGVGSGILTWLYHALK